MHLCSCAAYVLVDPSWLVVLVVVKQYQHIDWNVVGRRPGHFVANGLSVQECN